MNKTILGKFNELIIELKVTFKAWLRKGHTKNGENC